jgi:HlyD family secretion protein
MSDKDGLYRQQALDRLTSPEQLDDAVVTIGSGAVLTLLGLALITAGLVIWGFFGTVTVSAAGAGTAAERRAPVTLLFPELGGQR